MTGGGDLALTVLLVGFVFSQSYYFVLGLAMFTLYLTPPNRVPRRDPDSQLPITILIPGYKEPRSVLMDTIRRVRAADYPTDHIEIYVIYEEDDDVMGAYVDQLGTNTLRVREDDTAIWQRIEDDWPADDPPPQNKARSLTYALYRLDLEGVVSVLDADTIVPPDLFTRACVGLEEYDIVQSKQSVRNLEDGLIPAAEAMGMAAWCTNVYAHTTRGPYQLLGKAYFLDADILYDLRGWNPYDPTEDMALGVHAYIQGYSLAVIDRYILDLCPSRFRDWVNQKKRWVSGPYRSLPNPNLRWIERYRFAVTTIGQQLLCAVNVIGIPAGVAVFVLTLLGVEFPTSPLIVIILGFNALHWAYYTVQGYRAWGSLDLVHGNWARLKFHLFSNAITQMVYATFWVVPIVMAIVDLLRGERTTFEVTPKDPGT